MKKRLKRETPGPAPDKWEKNSEASNMAAATTSPTPLLPAKAVNYEVQSVRTQQRRRLASLTLVAVTAYLLLPAAVSGETVVKEKVISGRVTWAAADSPFVVMQDILVDSSAELTVEAGVDVRFAPETGLTVRGVLVADGTEFAKIRFLPSDPVVESQPNRTIRLVDGPTINEGIVQVLESGAWRSVCTNSRNWTAADMSVACRQLGFLGGEWSHWYPHLNDTRQILYQDPGESDN